MIKCHRGQDDLENPGDQDGHPYPHFRRGQVGNRTNILGKYRRMLDRVMT